MQNGCVLQDCKKPPQRRGVPLFCRKKRCIIKASGTGRENRGDAPRESLSASVKEAKEEHCHGNFARDQPGAGGSGVLRLPGQRPYPDRLEERLQARASGRRSPSIGPAPPCGSCCRTWTRRFPSRQRPCSVCSATSRAFPTAPSGPIVRLFCSSIPCCPAGRTLRP